MASERDAVRVCVRERPSRVSLAAAPFVCIIYVSISNASRRTSAVNARHGRRLRFFPFHFQSDCGTRLGFTVVGGCCRRSASFFRVFSFEFAIAKTHEAVASDTIYYYYGIRMLFSFYSPVERFFAFFCCTAYYRYIPVLYTY